MSDATQDERVNEALYQPHLPVLQDPHRLRQLEMKFGQYFTEKEQFEAFAMLPIADKNRAKLIKTLIAAQAERRAETEEKKLCA